MNFAEIFVNQRVLAYMLSAALLLFGATGDLAKRMLLPSLYALHEDELVSGDLRIVGTARSRLSDDDYRIMAREALETYLPEDRKDQHKIESFLDRLSYQPLDASDPDGFSELAEKVGDISKGLAIFFPQPHPCLRQQLPG